MSDQNKKKGPYFGDEMPPKVLEEINRFLLDPNKQRLPPKKPDDTDPEEKDSVRAY